MKGKYENLMLVFVEFVFGLVAEEALHSVKKCQVSDVNVAHVMFVISVLLSSEI
jgi:hypothetical protein